MSSSNATLTAPKGNARDNELTWPCAMWATLAVALNTMSQPSGKIFGFHSSYNFVRRASPVVCACFAIDSFVQLAMLTIKEHSPLKAAARLMEMRFELGAEDQDEGDGNFDSLRKKLMFRWILCLLGAVPQAIKIYATSGIPGMQACYSAYLAPFIVDEGLALLGRMYDRRQRSAHRRTLLPDREQAPKTGENQTTRLCFVRYVSGSPSGSEQVPQYASLSSPPSWTPPIYAHQLHRHLSTNLAPALCAGW
jgi:hypothetical protein